MGECRYENNFETLKTDINWLCYGQLTNVGAYKWRAHGKHLSGAPLCGNPVKLGLRNNYLEESRFNRLKISVWSLGFRNDPSGRVVPDIWDIPG